MPAKKSRSNDALKPSEGGTSGSNLSLSPPKDTYNFRIPKKTRFANRFIQIGLVMFAFGFLFHQNPDTIEERHLTGLNKGLWFLGVLSMFWSATGLIMYTFPLVLNWSSRKTLIIETIFDSVALVSWISAFSSIAATGSCPAGTNGCDLLNLLIMWEVLISLFFLAALGLDGTSLYFGIYGNDDVDDLEMRARIRSLSRG